MLDQPSSQSAAAPPSPMAIPAYAELRCVSNFSFLRGASQPEELVERAKQLGYAALAITDECSHGRRGARPRGGQGARPARC